MREHKQENAPDSSTKPTKRDLLNGRGLSELARVILLGAKDIHDIDGYIFVAATRSFEHDPLANR
jgi:hypothetical protein